MSTIKDETLFVNEQIENKNYLILPNTIAIGKVYKILAHGNLDKDGYEFGYLYLPIGSGIKTHIHTNDVERYKLLSGILTINNTSMDINICRLNCSHCIDPVKKPTIIQTCKINILHLDNINKISTETFENIISQEPKIKIR